MSREILSLATHDLACYAVAQFPSFELATHTRLIVDKLEAIERGEIKRLMIFMPPRHGKSLLSTQLFPAWYLGKNPGHSVISASYSQDLADDFGRKVRNLVADPLHFAIFPKSRLSDDSSGMRRFNTVDGGSYYAVGRGAGLTGRGAHLLLLDDLLKDREEAQSEVIRRGLHDWYGSVAYTRLQPGGAIVNIQTRWHEDDLGGRLLREHTDDGWDVLCLPAIAETDESFRKTGDALWPQKYPLPALQQIRTAIGGAAWASLYQQRPSAAEGAVFQRAWWRSYGEAPTGFKKIVLSLDTAFKTGAENDYSVGTVWGVTRSGFYLLHLWRQRVEFPELKRELATLAAEWNPNVILVEDKASGQSLIQELRADTTLPVKPIKVEHDKLTRAHAVTPIIEAGRVYLPEKAPWLEAFLDETAAFPNAPFDDIVDSVTQALNYMREPREPGIIGWYRQEAEMVGAAEEQVRSCTLRT